MNWLGRLLSSILALAGLFLVFIGFTDRRDGLAVAGAILLGAGLLAAKATDGSG